MTSKGQRSEGRWVRPNEGLKISRLLCCQDPQLRARTNPSRIHSPLLWWLGRLIVVPPKKTGHRSMGKKACTCTCLCVLPASLKPQYEGCCLCSRLPGSGRTGQKPPACVFPTCRGQHNRSLSTAFCGQTRMRTTHRRCQNRKCPILRLDWARSNRKWVRAQS